MVAIVHSRSQSTWKHEKSGIVQKEIGDTTLSGNCGGIQLFVTEFGNTLPSGKPMYHIAPYCIVLLLMFASVHSNLSNPSKPFDDVPW